MPAGPVILAGPSSVADVRGGVVPSSFSSSAFPLVPAIFSVDVSIV